ncbi:MAG TPA: phage holin family protein [Streptosporangiaceae bacterium]|nr:phage holin family protein [Streptosporangiaceae bacterium]
MARPAVTQSIGNASEPSIGDLVSQAIKDVTTLVRCEVDLAKVELRGDARRVGLAAALGGTIMFFGVLILVMLSFAYAEGLITAGIWTWAAYLIVAGTWAVLAAICALVIWVKVRGITGLRKTRESVQQDLAMLKRDEQTPSPPAVEAG